jgi:hypothetical protein
MKKSSLVSAYETRDARVPVVLAGIGALVLLIATSFVTVSLSFHGADRTSMGGGSERSFHHGAEEVSSIAEDWRAQEAAVQQHLQRYAWVDRAGGFVQIPIDRAMELMTTEASAQRAKTP